MRKTTLNTRKITKLVCLILLWQLLIIGNIPSSQALQQETPRPRVSKPTKVEAKESLPIDESDGSLSQTKGSKDSKDSKNSKDIQDTQDPKNSSNNQDISDDTGTIKIGVDYIQVAFSVVDEKNRLVTDLNPSEVKLYDNGQSQEPEFFQRSNNLPMMLAILIDTSASQQFLLPDEKNAVSTFFDAFFREGKDYGSVLSFNGETSLAIGLTSNLSRLKIALQRVKKDEIFRDDEGGVSSLSTALYDAIDITG
ncbi:MAG: von Willebrand factor type A domain-containing protein, partial [bacterium]